MSHLPYYFDLGSVDRIVDELRQQHRPDPGSPYERTALVAAQIHSVREFQSAARAAGRWPLVVSLISMGTSIAALGVSWLHG
jgi:hypothetical protein